MAIEKFINGKRDNCHHDGLASNRRRLAAAEYHQANWQEETEPINEVPLVPERSMLGVRRGSRAVQLQEGVLYPVRSEELNHEILYQ